MRKLIKFIPSRDLYDMSINEIIGYIDEIEQEYRYVYQELEEAIDNPS
jgi:hypothetical protein